MIEESTHQKINELIKLSEQIRDGIDVEISQDHRKLWIILIDAELEIEKFITDHKSILL